MKQNRNTVKINAENYTTGLIVISNYEPYTNPTFITISGDPSYYGTSANVYFSYEYLAELLISAS